MGIMSHINRNFAWCDEYSDSSFLGIFHEQNKWDDDEYFKLESELYQESLNLGHNIAIPRELSWRVMRIYSYLMLSLGCQYDPNDGFEIINITRDQFYERRERVQLVFEGFFSGKMPDKDILGY